MPETPETEEVHATRVADAEIQTIAKITKMISTLKPDSARRVLAYIKDRYAVVLPDGTPMLRRVSSDKETATEARG